MPTPALALPLIAVLLAGGPQPPTAVPPAPAHVTPAKGTAVSEVSHKCWYAFQAKNGDYWFGSDGDGVYRWAGEGKPIINYTTADGLSGNAVRGIRGDKHGNVYFTTFGGICKFDGHTFATLPVAATPDDAGGWRLNPDDLWFPWFKGMPTASNAPGAEGPYRYDGTNLYHLNLPTTELATKFRAELPNATWSPNDIYSIYRDSRGHLWFGTALCGACRYDGRSFAWLFEDHLTNAPNGGSFGIRSVIEDNDGAFRICNTRYLFRVQPESKDGKVVYTREDAIDEKDSDGPLYFQGAVKDAKGDLWLAPYGGGIWRYDGAKLTNYPVNDGDVGTQVVSISMDNQGGIWLGTPTAGPYRFDGKAFVKFRP